MDFRIPSSFRLSGINHSVKFNPQLARDSRLHGSSTFATHSIELDSTNSPEQQKVTFLHECLHHIDSLYDAGLKESQVTRLAHGLHELIQQLEVD